MSTANRCVEVIGVPTDLGANMRGAIMGPSAVRMCHLKEKIEILGISVVDHGDLAIPVRESMLPGAAQEKYLSAITALCRQLEIKTRAALENGRVPLALGGDHSLAIGTIAGAAGYFAEKHHESLGLLWVDAHGDLNTPQTTPSGNIHGMPLAVVLGQGHDSLLGIGKKGPKVKPENTVLVGIRTIDGLERQQLRSSGVRFYTMREIDERGMFTVMKEALEIVTRNTGGVHLSFDIDAMDPLHAPGVSTPELGGLSLREAHLALEMLADTKKLCSMDFVELNPFNDVSHKTSILCVDLVLSALGKSIV